MAFIIFPFGFDAAVGETSPSAPLAQPPPLSRGGFGMSVRFMLDEQSTMSREQECSAVKGSGSLTRCVVQKQLPSVARPALLRHIAPRASSRKWPDLPKPLPMGEVALRSNDGEGKPGTKEPLRSDGQALCQRETSAAPVLPRQQPCPLRRSRASSPKGRAFYLLTTPAPPLTGWAV